ncbi:MAG: insulinase family protein [Isosphaeraceae bacterium]
MPSRRHRLAWAVALFLCGLAGSRPVGARGILPPDCQDTTLPNGLRVVTIPWDSPGIIALSTVVFAGPRDETQPHLIALSNVASRLVETGGDRSRNEEMRRRFAVESSVTFEQDATVHSQTFPSAALQTILAEQARRLVTPEFTPARFRAAVDAEVSRLRRRLSVPAGRADWELRVLTSPTASLETPGVDIVESLEKLGDRPAEALETLDRWYRPERCVLVLAGQVEHAGALQLVERCFGSWKRGGVAVDTPPRSVSVGARAREIKLPGRFDAVLRVAYPIPGRELDDPEGPALAALAEAIFGATGPLYQALVVDEKSVAELSAEPKSSRERGWFTIRARIRTRRTWPTFAHGSRARSSRRPRSRSEGCDWPPSSIGFAFVGSPNSTRLMEWLALRSTHSC